MTWIKTKDRLPKNGQKVWYYRPPPFGTFCGVFRKNTFISGLGFFHKDDVLCWQPRDCKIPEPPEDRE